LQSPRVKESSFGSIHYLTFEEEGVQIVIDSTHGIVQSLVREAGPSRTYLDAREAEEVARSAIRCVLGYLPEGTMQSETKGERCYPHWKVEVIRSENGIPAGSAVTVWVWGDEVVNFACSDVLFANVEVTGEPSISKDEATRIARGLLPDSLRRLLDSPYSVSLEYSYFYEEVMEELVPGHSVLMPQRSSDNMVLCWAVSFDDRKMVIDATDGRVVQIVEYWKSHNYVPELIKISLLATGLAFALFAGRRVAKHLNGSGTRS
jgi:hypothetical protein